jgi:phospholipid-binding lipoprotein MlaA
MKLPTALLSAVVIAGCLVAAAPAFAQGKIPSVETEPPEEKEPPAPDELGAHPEIPAPATLRPVGERPIDRYDPWERMNRRFYRFNAHFDKLVFLPSLRVYRILVPTPLRIGFSNFLSNLGQLTSLANSILQLSPKKTAVTLGRFVVNSTLGCAGLADPATYMGLIDYHEDFGQTLGRWGMGPGPYLVLPIGGPSSLRDGVGWGVDVASRSYMQSQIVDVSLLDPAYDAWLVATWLQARDDQPFRYGELGPFEYDLVRYFYLEHRDAEIAF